MNCVHVFVSVNSRAQCVLLFNKFIISNPEQFQPITCILSTPQANMPRPVWYPLLA